MIAQLQKEEKRNRKIQNKRQIVKDKIEKKPSKKKQKDLQKQNDYSKPKMRSRGEEKQKVIRIRVKNQK